MIRRRRRRGPGRRCDWPQATLAAPLPITRLHRPGSLSNAQLKADGRLRVLDRIPRRCHRILGRSPTRPCRAPRPTAARGDVDSAEHRGGSGTDRFRRRRPPPRHRSRIGDGVRRSLRRRPSLEDQRRRDPRKRIRAANPIGGDADSLVPVMGRPSLHWPCLWLNRGGRPQRRPGPRRRRRRPPRQRRRQRPR